MRRGPALSIAVAIALVTAGGASADPAPEDDEQCRTPVRLRPDGGRYGAPDLVLTAVSAGTIIATALIPPLPRHSRGGVLLDESARDVLRLPRDTQRRAARDASDALLDVMLAFPFVVDAAAYTAWYRDSREVGWNLALVNLETLVLTEAVRGIFNVVVSRERPYGRECGSGLPNEVIDCDSRSRYHSFFSGHSSETFASAALTCSHHLNLQLYGGGWADAAPCLAGFAVATTTAVLRVVSDMHYVSDVVVDAAFGTAMGLTVPWLVLYRRRGARTDSAAGGLQLVFVPTANGAGIAGVF